MMNNIVSPLLLECLKKIMAHHAFNDFYLVGGTSLALQRRHRDSIDIDLFTNLPYGNIDTENIKKALIDLFPYIENVNVLDNQWLVYSMFIGNNKENMIKLDICYDENPIFPFVDIDGIRMLSEKDIAAMKIFAITQKNQRKKDFWDIHDLLESYKIEDLVDFSLRRYPYQLNLENIIDGFKRLPDIQDFTIIKCHKGKYWEFIIEDLMEQIPLIERLKLSDESRR